MKVELSIADDRELRRHIRDIIKGEVLSIARGEIKSIIAEAVKEKAIPGSGAEIELMVRRAISERIKDELGASGYGRPTWIQNEARAQIAQKIADVMAGGKFT